MAEGGAIKMIKFSSFLKNVFRKIGIFFGAISIIMLLPVLWTFALITDGSAIGSSTVELYTKFVLSHPFVILLMVLCMIWMLLSLSTRAVD